MGLSGWRDAAIVLLALEAFIGVLVVGVVYFYAVRGVVWLKQRIPTVTRPAAMYLQQAERATRRAGNIAIAPIIQAGASTARIKAAWKQLIGANGRNTHV
jgi:hypothetical protein